MRALRLASFLVVAAVGGMAAPAFADIQAVGYAEEGGSWSQFFSVSDVNDTDTAFNRWLIVVQPITGYTSILEEPAATNFADFDTLAPLGTWQQDGPAFDSDTDAHAQPGYLQVEANDTTATDRTSMLFRLHMTSNASDGVHFTIYFFDSTTTGYDLGDSVGSDEISYVGTVVPMPAAFWCGLFLMGGLGAAYAAKRRQRVLA